jgi:lysozyme
MTDPALPAAVEIITNFEGFRSVPYRDTGGVWTIAYGETYLPDGSRVTASTAPVSQPTALAWLTAGVSKTLMRVRELVHVPISNNGVSSLVSFSWNVGTGALANSTLLRLLNEHAPLQHVAGQFSAWVYDARGHVDPGLIRRRAAEAALFLKPDTPAAETAEEIGQNPQNSASLSTDSPSEEISPADTLNDEELDGTLGE